MTDTPSLTPINDPVVTPADDLVAAGAGAVAIPANQIPVSQPAAEPFGYTWVFDWETGQFKQAGQSPSVTTRFGALEEWCQMAMHAARYAHPVFSDAFGMDQPDSLIGEFALGEALGDWQAALIEALMVHDRITSVGEFDMTWDPSEGVLTINSFLITTDEDQTVAVSDVTLTAGGA
jgi:hypothetical protein